MVYLRSLFLSLVLVGASKNAEANGRFLLDFNGFYSSDTTKLSSTTTSTLMFGEALLGMGLDKKARYVIGWNYLYYSSADKTTTTSNFSASDMGPKFIFYFSKSKNFSLGVAYHLLGTGTVSGSGTTEKLRGTSIKGDLSWGFMMGESSFFGVRLNYYSASFTESITGTTNLSTVTYQKTDMFPSLFYSLFF